MGRYEEEEDAARARDLAILCLGLAREPRLNFDADHCCASEVELLVGGS